MIQSTPNSGWWFIQNTSLFASSIFEICNEIWRGWEKKGTSMQAFSTSVGHNHNLYLYNTLMHTSAFHIDDVRCNILLLVAWIKVIRTVTVKNTAFVLYALTPCKHHCIKDNSGPRESFIQRLHCIAHRQRVLYVYRHWLALSCGFLSPANTILVPGMYFLGARRYSNSVSSFHVMPLFLLACV